MSPRSLVALTLFATLWLAGAAPASRADTPPLLTGGADDEFAQERRYVDDGAQARQVARSSAHVEHAKGDFAVHAQRGLEARGNPHGTVGWDHPGLVRCLDANHAAGLR